MESRQALMLRRLVELCHREECDLVLFAGDVFDGAGVSGDLLRAATRCFEDMGVPVFVAPGNHDHLGLNSPYDQVLWPENVHIFRSPRIESVTLQELDLTVWGAGYTSMDCPPLLENFTAHVGAGYRLAVLHADPVMAGSPCCPVTREQMAASGLHYLALGHIHKAGGFTVGHTCCAWPGCPMGRGFHECGAKGALVVELYDGQARPRFVDLGLGQFRELSVEAGDDPAADILGAMGGDAGETAFRITLTGQREPVDTEQLTRALESRCFLLELRDETRPPVELWASAGEDTLEGLYFRFLQKELECAGEKDAAVLTLAAKISRRLLDGQEVKLP